MPLFMLCKNQQKQKSQRQKKYDFLEKKHDNPINQNAGKVFFLLLSTKVAIMSYPKNFDIFFHKSYEPSAETSSR